MEYYLTNTKNIDKILKLNTRLKSKAPLAYIFVLFSNKSIYIKKNK